MKNILRKFRKKDNGNRGSEECPKWLLDFVSKISSLLNPLGFIGQLGFRYLSQTQIK